MKKLISINHFDKIVKQIEKKTILNYSVLLEDNKNTFSNDYNESFKTDLISSLDKLKKSYHKNILSKNKSYSRFILKYGHYDINISYTFEDKNWKESNDPTYLTIRVYIVINGGKHRLIRHRYFLG